MKKAAAAVVVIIILVMGAFFMYRHNVIPEIRAVAEMAQKKAVDTRKADPVMIVETAEEEKEPETEAESAVSEEVTSEEISENEAPEEEPASIFSTERSAYPDPTAETIEESDDRSTFEKPAPNYYYEGED